MSDKLNTSDSELKLFHDLDLEKSIQAAAKILGYRKVPPTIDQFLTEDYYMGKIFKNLYPFWRKKLRLIYPTPIHTSHPIVVMRGGIGTGKSTFARAMACYTMCRLLHLKNPHDTFKMVPGKFIDFNFFSYTSGLANSEFIEVINNWWQSSPFFTECLAEGRLDGITLTSDGPRGNSAISKDIIFYNMSEINFINKERAHEKLDSALKRWDSRFGRFKYYFGHLLIDTSSKGDDSIADEFVDNNPYDDVLVINTNQWLVREHLGYYGRKGWFTVFCGDGTHSPFIVSELNPKTDEMDPDRFIQVPEELRSDFEFDLITALQDKAGISTSSSDVFFPDTNKLDKCYDIPMSYKEVEIFDFFDKKDKLIYRFDSALRRIPDDKIIYPRYDIGVVNDLCGLAISYFDGWFIYDKDKKIKYPKYKVPLATGLSRNADEETSIYHLFEFIMDLSERFEIGMFTADQYASRQLFQDLRREGINVNYLSVDRTDEAYVYFKTLTINKLVSLPMNNLLKTEHHGLIRVGNKIDHRSTGSKDTSDAVVGSIFSCYQDIDHASMLSNKYKLAKHSDILEQRYKSSSSDIFEDSFKTLYD